MLQPNKRSDCYDNILTLDKFVFIQILIHGAVIHN
jgi:hypothetical protein